MGRVIEGKVDAKGMRIGIIVSRFNNFVTERLLEGALEALRTHGGEERDIDIVRVPGAFEIPLLAHKMAAAGKYDALVCLGAVIRGETPHFEYIADAVTLGIEQAMARAGEKMGNKGFEAALTAIEMASLNREIP